MSREMRTSLRSLPPSWLRNALVFLFWAYLLVTNAKSGVLEARYCLEEKIAGSSRLFR